MLLYVYNNFKKQPFEYSRVQKWCAEFKVPSVYFNHLQKVGAISKIGKGIFVLNDYNSTTWKEVLEYQRVQQRASAAKKKGKVPTPVVELTEKKLIPLQIKIDEAVDLLKGQGYRIQKPTTIFEEV